VKSIITIRNDPRHPSIFDITLDNISQFRQYSSVECTLFFYPYNREVNADDFVVLPFEEYVDNIVTAKQSTYRKIRTFSENIFGLFLGLLIFSVFANIKPEDLISIESIVSIFGAYAIGKEIWQDIDIALITISNSWKIRWVGEKFHYIREEFGTIRQFWEKARLNRYGRSNILPSKMDFIKHSNSKTIELFFSKGDLNQVKKESSRILSIIMKEDRSKQRQKLRYMIGSKITLSHKVLFFSYDIELFQSISCNKNDTVGAIDSENVWNSNSVLKKHILRLGRCKCYLRTSLLGDCQMIVKR